ncbi:MAG: hypothetical protein H6735_30760 [Alphaproteobacteria bacterium]|nr:hypothetical protein [Alphaproteobacteria bacterium]
MADLVTHACTALLPGAAFRSRAVGVVALGAVLPDLCGRVIPLGLELLGRAVPLPEWVTWPWTALHEPLGWSLTAGLLASSFVEGQRARAFRLLALGCTLHTLVDLLQDHHGEGYLLLAPLSVSRFELGWIGSEATVPWALPLLAATALAWVPAGIERATGRVPEVRWLRVAAVLVPVHALLPVALWALGLDVAGLVAALAWLHVAGAGFLLGTWRWWRGQVPLLLALLVADHAASLLVASALLP